MTPVELRFALYQKIMLLLSVPHNCLKLVKTHFKPKSKNLGKTFKVEVTFNVGEEIRPENKKLCFLIKHR